MNFSDIKNQCITPYESVGAIIESIAMIEKSLAHILNAESEKLHVIIDLPEITPDQLLIINQSVKDTIDAIIKLELIIQSKLVLCESMICE